MTAKEMFEELGYELKYENGDVKRYLMVKHIPNRIDTKYINFTEIEFALNGVKVGSWETNAYIERTKTFDYTFLTPQELKAINKQVEELWGDE